jgi:tetratricopeptide (TPR) repeat protein
MLNKSDNAVTSYEKCTTIDPTNVDGWNQKGLALINLGRFQEALNAYDQATKITVKNASVWNNKGLAFAALGKPQDALQCFNKALGLKPDFADALKNKESVMGKLQVVNISGTITPTVTVSRIGTLFTTVTPSPLPTQITPQITVTEEPQKTSVPVAKKTTYSPVSPLTALAAVFVVVGIMLWVNSNRK